MVKLVLMRPERGEREPVEGLDRGLGDSEVVPDRREARSAPSPATDAATGSRPRALRGDCTGDRDWDRLRLAGDRDEGGSCPCAVAETADRAGDFLISEAGLLAMVGRGSSEKEARAAGTVPPGPLLTSVSLAAAGPAVLALSL